jgi:glycosyltransferase involved in cell wall biosynthesis
LTLVSASPRKNAAGLLRIYAQLPAELQRRHPLVMVWTHGLMQRELRREIERLGLGRCVLFLSRVPDGDLVLLYNAATLFVYPSLYEGFGLPVLEAMACGTPVVASNLTSIPEVAGESAALADPRDAKQFGEALSRTLSSPQVRIDLARAGFERAQQYSWERTARMTLDVYREAGACGDRM